MIQFFLLPSNSVSNSISVPRDTTSFNKSPWPLAIKLVLLFSTVFIPSSSERLLNKSGLFNTGLSYLISTTVKISQNLVFGQQVPCLDKDYCLFSLLLFCSVG